MKKLLIACSLALATTSCATTGILDPTQICSTQFVMDDRAMASAELLYNVPAQAYVTLNRRGQLSQATKDSVKPKLLKAFEWLDKAYNFYHAKDAANFSCAMAQLTTYSDTAKSLLGVQ